MLPPSSSVALEDGAPLDDTKFQASGRRFVIAPAGGMIYAGGI